MADFDVIGLQLGELQTNSFIIAADDGSAAVVDPAANAAEILSVLAEEGLTLKKILLTHGHFDHTGACVQLRKETGAEIYIHKDDEELLEDGGKALAFFVPTLVYEPFRADVLLSGEETVEVGGCEFRVLHTPGHTRGSVCYIGGNRIFAGDTFFCGSVGRTDCYGGDSGAQAQSLRRVAALRGEYIVHAGHGGDTTLYDEVNFNPFFVRYAR